MSFRLIIAAFFGALWLGVSPQVALGLAQTPPVPATSGTAGGDVVVIAKGHVDIGPKLIDGVWQAALRDDTVSPPVWRKLSEVVLHVVDAAKTPVPDSAEYKFLNLPAGSTPWVIPQTQNPEVVWVGWNTQDPEAAGLMGRGTNLTLNKMTGPAPVNLFLQDGGFGPPRVLWQTEKGAGQPIWMEVNSHVHMNWVFAQAGEYTFDLTMTAEAGNPAPSAQGNLRVVVGTGTQPKVAGAKVVPTESATAGNSAEVTTPATQAAAAPNSATTPATASNSSSPLVWVAAAGAALVLLVAIATVLWRQRQARAASEQAFVAQS